MKYRLSHLVNKFAVSLNQNSDGLNVPLFFTFAFFKLHEQEESTDFYLLLNRISDGAYVGSAAFYSVEDNHYNSPLRGTFGGFHIEPPFRSLELYEFFWKE